MNTIEKPYDPNSRWTSAIAKTEARLHARSLEMRATKSQMLTAEQEQAAFDSFAEKVAAHKAAQASNEAVPTQEAPALSPTPQTLDLPAEVVLYRR